MNTKPVFITDFDGTLSKEDFFWAVVDTFLNKKDLAPWQDYLNGKITHIAALNAIFAKLKITQKQMDEFINNIEIDSCAYKTLQLCKQLNMPIYVCSAGTDYYIKKRIGGWLSEFNITLVANSGVFSPEEGLKMIAPSKDSEFYGENAGVSKAKLVESLKNKGYFCIFAGDGPPDFEAAQFSDVVFAKKLLLEMCQKEGLKTEKFNGYNDIYNYLEKHYVHS